MVLTVNTNVLAKTHNATPITITFMIKFSDVSVYTDAVSFQESPQYKPHESKNGSYDVSIRAPEQDMVQMLGGDLKLFRPATNSVFFLVHAINFTFLLKKYIVCVQHLIVESKQTKQAKKEMSGSKDVSHPVTSPLNSPLNLPTRTSFVFDSAIQLIRSASASRRNTALENFEEPQLPNLANGRGSRLRSRIDSYLESPALSPSPNLAPNSLGPNSLNTNALTTPNLVRKDTSFEWHEGQLSILEQELSTAITDHLKHLNLTKGPLFPDSKLQFRQLSFKNHSVTARSGHVSAFVNDKLIIYGGYSKQTLTDHIFLCDCSKGDPNSINYSNHNHNRNAKMSHSHSSHSKKSDSGKKGSSSKNNSTKSSKSAKSTKSTKSNSSNNNNNNENLEDGDVAVIPISTLEKIHKTFRVGSDCVSLSHNDCLYIFGGWNDQKYINHGLLLNLYNRDSIKLVAEQTKDRLLPPARRDHTLVKMGPYLLLFGGWSNDNCDNDLWLLGSNWKWQKIGVNGIGPCARRGHSASVINNKMYIFGGLYGFTKYLNDLFVYNAENNEWEEPTLIGLTRPDARAWHTANVIGDSQILIFGGTAGRLDFFNDIWVFDTHAMFWFQIDPIGSIPKCRATHTMVQVHGDKKYLSVNHEYENELSEISHSDINDSKKSHEESESSLTDRIPTAVRETILSQRQERLRLKQQPKQRLRLIMFGGLVPIIVENKDKENKEDSGNSSGSSSGSETETFNGNENKNKNKNKSKHKNKNENKNENKKENTVEQEEQEQQQHQLPIAKSLLTQQLESKTQNKNEQGRKPDVNDKNYESKSNEDYSDHSDDDGDLVSTDGDWSSSEDENEKNNKLYKNAPMNKIDVSADLYELVWMV